MADNRKERKELFKVTEEWNDWLDDLKLDKEQKGTQMNKNYLAHIKHVELAIRYLRQNPEGKARDVFTTEELLREMRLEMAQIGNLEPDFSVDETLKALQEVRQDPESWY